MSQGYFDDVYIIFKARQHPFILVEEAAFRWMGQRVCHEEDLDLLIRDSEINAIKADLLATGQFELAEQDLSFRFSDPYTLQVPRLRLKKTDVSHNCISLWSERVYMLNVDGEKIQVPEIHAWNVVLMEERFDIDSSWANAASISFTTKTANGVKIVPTIRSQSSDMDYPIYIPSIPCMLDALLDQSHYRVTHPEEYPSVIENRARYHLSNFIRYLHLEKLVQREKVLPELAERNRGEMKVLLDKFKRKPLVTLASLQAEEEKKKLLPMY